MALTTSQDRLLNIENTGVQLQKGLVRLERGQEEINDFLDGIDKRLDGIASDIYEIKGLLKS